MKKTTIKSAAKPKAKAAMKKVPAIPKGYHAVTPYLIVNNAAKAIDFYKKAFAAKEIMRMEKPHGKIGHAELKIGDAKIMLADEHLEMGAKSPSAYGGSPVSIHVYIKDVDTVVQRAVAAGAKLIKPVADQFYGDRSGMIADPFGHQWCISTHIEHLTPAQMKKRSAEAFAC